MPPPECAFAARAPPLSLTFFLHLRVFPITLHEYPKLRTKNGENTIFLSRDSGAWKRRRLRLSRPLVVALASRAGTGGEERPRAIDRCHRRDEWSNRRLGDA